MKDDAPYAGVVLKFMELAKENLQRDGQLVMVIGFMRGTEILNISPLRWETDNDKWRKFFAVGAFLKITHCDGLIVVTDAAMRVLTDAPKETINYVMDNLATESPLTLPEGKFGRRECIIVQYLNPVSRISDVVIQAYRHEGPDRHIVFEERFDQRGPLQEAAQFEGEIRDSVYAGYDKSDSMDIKSVE
jgi:hypothetical protein